MQPFAHRRLNLEVDGGELDGLSLGVVERRVQGVRADGGVEDGGLLAGRGRLVRRRFGQHGDGMRRRLNGGRLQQLPCRPLGRLALEGHKLLLLLLMLLGQGVGLYLSVGCWGKRKGMKLEKKGKKLQYTLCVCGSLSGAMNWHRVSECRLF